MPEHQRVVGIGAGLSKLADVMTEAFMAGGIDPAREQIEPAGQRAIHRISIANVCENQARKRGLGRDCTLDLR
jgi:hypothetical protein